ncbi:MAG TPA: hypothetical protein PLO41_04040 [Rubrivivax sp.]|nr:hypothetical protein [Rubrivivax sp.]
MKPGRPSADRGAAGSEPRDVQRAPPALEMCFRCEAPFPKRAVRFPCDRHGKVDIDALDDARRDAYLFARVLVRLGYAQSRIVDGAASECFADVAASG